MRTTKRNYVDCPLNIEQLAKFEKMALLIIANVFVAGVLLSALVH